MMACPCGGLQTLELDVKMKVPCRVPQPQRMLHLHVTYALKPAQARLQSAMHSDNRQPTSAT